MLGGELGQCLAAEFGEFADCLLRLGQPLSDLGDLCLKPGDLSLARVGDLAGVLHCLDPSFELDTVSVRASAVERGEVNSGLSDDGRAASGGAESGDQGLDHHADPRQLHHLVRSDAGEVDEQGAGPAVRKTGADDNITQCAGHESIKWSGATKAKEIFGNAAGSIYSGITGLFA